MQISIPLRALSVNKAWTGRRFKSDDYKQFEEDASKVLKRSRTPVKGWVEISYTFYVKNYAMADVDNLVKPIQDILVKYNYIEDDRKVVWFSAEKVKVDTLKEEKMEIEIRPFG